MVFGNETVKKVILFIGFVFLHSVVIADDKKNQLENNTTLSTDIFHRSKVSLREGNFFFGRLYINPHKVWEKSFSRGDYKSHYIKSIVAKVDERKVLDVHLGGYQYLQDYLRIKFKFMNFSSSSKSIDYTVIGNQGKVAKKSFKLIRKKILNKDLLVDTQTKEKNNTINPKAFEATTVNGAIEALYGKDTLEHFLDSPKNYITYNHSDINYMGVFHFRYTSMYLRIKSKKEIASIAFFYTGNDFPLITVFNITSVALPYLEIVLKPGRSFKNGNIIVIAKGRDGKIYQSKLFYVDSTISNTMDDEHSFIDFTIK